MIIYNGEELTFTFVGTREYNAAIAIQRPIEAVLEDMNSNIARAESKRKWVDSLVCKK